MKSKQILSEKLRYWIDRYFNLDIGSKKVPCPYYINSRLNRGNLAVMSGKGTPEEIELETKIWAKVHGFDLYGAEVGEIRQFMQYIKVGIDCSGFICQVFDNYIRKLQGRSLISYLKFADMNLRSRLRRYLRPIENIGAEQITSLLNCNPIGIEEMMPGDLIRAKGKQKNASHLAMVSEVIRDNATVISFRYIHSHREYKDENGVREGEVFITNPNSDLSLQEWREVQNGRNYMYEDLMEDYEDNGLRRLKFSRNIKLFN